MLSLDSEFYKDYDAQFNGIKISWHLNKNN